MSQTRLEQCYKVELLSDVVITADAATAGGHHGLDYMPGSLFSGACVSLDLRSGHGFDAEFFLSGKVRFLDALPAAEGEPTFPVPFCFHTVKGEDWVGNEPLNHLVSTRGENGKQVQQLRSGYMTLDGKVVKVIRELRIKTAVDRNERRSKEGQLFGYESIPRGTVLFMRVQADMSGDLEKVKELFSVRELRLGKSRRAEFGLARLSPVDLVEPGSPVKVTDSAVHIYLKSDTALVRDGIPVLRPLAVDFGLPEDARFIIERSFVRTRRYSPWNSFFNCRMTERQVLSKGSVITFQLSEGSSFEPAELQRRLDRGVGLYRNEGLGQVLVNPGWLLSPPKLVEATAVEPLEGKVMEPSDSILVSYLKTKKERQEHEVEAFKQGRSCAKKWARRAKAIAKQGHTVPSKSQWAAMRELALMHEAEPERIKEEIENFCKHGLRKKVWKDAMIREGSMLDAVSTDLEKVKGSMKCRVLYHATVEMSRLISREEKR